MIGRLLIAGAVSLGLVAATPVCGQQNFPDVPDNHWAYEALLILKRDGLLVGYPDGTYGGPRPLSRYEFAAAMHRAYTKLKLALMDRDKAIDELQKRIQSIEIEEPSLDGLATKADLQALKDQLRALQTGARQVRAYREDIDALQKLFDAFGKDLAALGVDVAAIEKDLRSLEARITALENAKPPVEISGDLNVVGFGGHSEGGHFGVSWTGNPVGSDGAGNPVGIAKDLHLVHETGVTLSGVYGRDVAVEGEIVFSSLFPYEFGMFSGLAPGWRKDEWATDFLVHHLTANWGTKWFGTDTDITLGRVGYASSNYFAFTRIDPDPYVDIQRWDDRKWYFDGGIIGFELGSADLTFLGGKQARTGSTWYSYPWLMLVGSNNSFFTLPARGGNQWAPGDMAVETHVGTELTFQFAKNSHVAAQYFLIDGEETTLPANPVSAAVTFNRLATLGADAEIQINNNLTFYGTFAEADLYYGSHVRQTEDNHAFDVALEYHQGERWWLGAGYRYVTPFFSGPGYWDRLGYWYNPTDIKGFAGWYHHRFPSGTKVWLSGAVYNGTELATTGGGSKSYGLMNDDEILSLNGYVSVPLSSRWDLLFGWEGVYWTIAPRADWQYLGGDVDENYYTVELSYDLGKDTDFRIGYQFSDYDNKSGLPSFNPASDATDTKARGGLIFTQLSIGF
jgi:hypothetical protein